ncbi:MAG: MFS transporter [Candidatus Riflebacteria bacterium]|nr:MFS transporter [Candidatus Riflebacteria bacterium]
MKEKSGLLISRNRDFLFLWIGQVLSQAGTKMYQLAVAWWILSMTGENGGKALGFFMVMGAIPSILLFKYVGHIVDKNSSKKILVLSDLLAFLLMAVVVVGLKGSVVGLKLMFLLNFFVAVIEAFYNPTLGKCLPELVDSSDMESAVAFQSSTQYLASFGGAVAGAALIEKLGLEGITILNGLSYAVAAYCNWIINFKPVIALGETSDLGPISEQDQNKTLPTGSDSVLSPDLAFEPSGSSSSESSATFKSKSSAGSILESAPTFSSESSQGFVSEFAPDSSPRPSATSTSGSLEGSNSQPSTGSNTEPSSGSPIGSSSSSTSESSTGSPSISSPMPELDKEKMASGFNFFKNYPLLGQILIGFGMVNFFVTPILVILPMFTKLSLNSSATTMGILEASLWVGLLAGTFSAGLFDFIKNIIKLGALSVFVFGLAMLLSGIFVNAFFYGAMLFIAGYSIGVNNVKFVTLFQIVVDPEIKGKFFALMQALISFSFPIAFMVFGYLGDCIGPVSTCRVQGIGTMFLSIYFFVLSHRESELHEKSATSQ